MKLKMMVSVLLIALIVLLTACGGNNASSNVYSESALQDDSAAETQSIRIIDMTGREIVLDKPAERIVALTAADCEILYALDAADALVGRGEYCNWPQEVLQLPDIKSGRETNIEQILSLQPDVLLMGTMDQSEEQIAQLEGAGIHVVISDADDIEGAYATIEMIGDLMGCADRADALITDMKSKFEALSANIDTDENKTVYFEVSPLQYGLWAAGSNTFMDEVANMLGLTNIFSDIDGWGTVSEEQVIERDPDYIVTISMYFGEGMTPIEEIMSRPAWSGLSAVREGRILNLQNDELTRPGPRLVDGAQLLYNFVYGE